MTLEDMADVFGLSPLARGNPDEQRVNAAHLEAYPRSHGATADRALEAFTRYGLSPLARGNHYCPTIERVTGGPIPARTGQPTAAT